LTSAAATVSPTLMALSYPISSFTCFRLPREAVHSRARQRADIAGWNARCFEEVRIGHTSTGPYDLVDHLRLLQRHGRPPGAARHIRQISSRTATWRWSSPSPVPKRGPTPHRGRGGAGLLLLPRSCGVPETRCPRRRLLAGRPGCEEPIRRLATDAGYTRFRRVADTPFNLVYEVPAVGTGEPGCTVRVQPLPVISATACRGSGAAEAVRAAKCGPRGSSSTAGSSPPIICHVLVNWIRCISAARPVLARHTRAPPWWWDQRSGQARGGHRRATPRPAWRRPAPGRSVPPHNRFVIGGSGTTVSDRGQDPAAWSTRAPAPAVLRTSRA